MLRRLALLATIAATLTGCANVAYVSPAFSAKDFPTLGAVVTREVGETLVEQENIQTYDAAYFSQKVKYGLSAVHVGFNPGTPYVANQSINGKVAYCGPGLTCGGFNNDCGEGRPVCFAKGKSPSEIEVVAKFGLETVSVPPDLIRYGKAAASSNAGFRRHLVYTGKSGSVLHLGYREFIDDLARPAFSQDLNFDLAEGRVVGFKGARFEIISATNMSITYKMTSGFPDRPGQK